MCIVLYCIALLSVFCTRHHQLCKSLAVQLSAKYGVGKSMLILLQNPSDPVLKPSVYTMFCNSCLELHCNWSNPPGSDDCLASYSHTTFTIIITIITITATVNASSMGIDSRLSALPITGCIYLGRAWYLLDRRCVRSQRKRP